jgi:hypothetical protein
MDKESPLEVDFGIPKHRGNRLRYQEKTSNSGAPVKA